MKTYIAFLRAINVSGKRKIKMADLKSVLVGFGFKEVQTYIQSGNVVFKSDILSITTLEQKVYDVIKKHFGFDVPVVIKKPQELVSILDASPFKDPKDLEAKQVYYAFLKQQPDNTLKEALDSDAYPNEKFLISENCVYLNYLKGAGKAKLTNNVIENKLKVTATTRNHRTLLKLLKLSSI